MSSKIWDGLLHHSLLMFVALLSASVLVHSDQTVDFLKSFKSSENVTYDCVDIFKQPSLDHPLLKTHKIQMKPSVSRPQPKNQVGNKTYKTKITCRDGKVPILRNTKEYTSNPQHFKEIHVDPLTINGPRIHISRVGATSGGPYHGIQASFDGYELNVSNDQASYASIYIGTKTNVIHAGWMINPSVFGDRRVWSFGYWRGKDGKSCYINVNCPGFVQIAKDHLIGYPKNPGSYIGWWFHYSIHQDKQTGNWWITKLDQYSNIDIGYWPKELFDDISNGAEVVAAGGAVQASPSGLSPPMGNGLKPNQQSALFINIDVLDSNYVQQNINSIPIKKSPDSNCYGLEIEKQSHEPYFYFKYGGPGGNSC